MGYKINHKQVSSTLLLSLAAILKICKSTPFPGSDLWRLFSGSHHDLLKHLKQ